MGEAMIDRFFDDRLRAKMVDPDDVDAMTILMPVDLDPFERHYRFSVHLDAELRLADLGCSVGGGTLFGEGEDGDGDRGRENEVCFCVCDVDATDVDGARALLRLHLPELGCPDGTMIHYGETLEDRYDGGQWTLGQERSFDEA